MSFADELRSYNADEVEKEQYNRELAAEVAKYIEILKSACKASTSNREHSTTTYCTTWYDDGYSGYTFSFDLPTTDSYFEENKEFNKEKHINYGIHYVGTGSWEKRLYDDYVCFKSNELERARLIQRRIDAEMNKMGFISHEVALLELDDVYLVYKRTANLLGTVHEKLSTRIGDKIYIIKMSASW